MLKAKIQIQDKEYSLNLSSPIDISIPLGRIESPNAFYLTRPVYETVEAGGFVGNVARGGSCNCENILFNPHGDGTHTECAGHVAAERISINEVLKQFIFPARLITVEPGERGPDKVVSANSLREKLSSDSPLIEAVVIRTLPNSEDKKGMNYSGSNPPFFEADCMNFLNGLGIKHIVTDLPSLDKEDDPNLTAHKIFFREPAGWNLEKTVTEMAFIPSAIEDGLYLLNLQIASFESDASPSKPVLYRLT